MHSRPWYGFVYYALGAQGSFFAWILAFLAVFITWREAVLYAFNRGPAPAEVRVLVAEAPGLRRWVTLEGVEVDLRALYALGVDGPLGAVETVLLDRHDPAAIRLLGTLDTLADLRSERADLHAERARTGPRIASALRDARRQLRRRPPAHPLLVRPPTAVVRQRGVIADALARADALRAAHERTGVREDELFKSMDKALLDLEAELAANALQPEGAVLVVADIEAPASAAAPVEPTVAPPPVSLTEDAGAGLTSIVARWRERVDRRARRLGAAVRRNVTREGVLTRLPPTRQDSYRERYGGLVIAASALVVGHRPNQVAFIVMAAATALLVLLSVGLLALRSADAPAGTKPDDDAPADNVNADDVTAGEATTGSAVTSEPDADDALEPTFGPDVDVAPRGAPAATGPSPSPGAAPARAGTAASPASKLTSPGDDR